MSVMLEDGPERPEWAKRENAGLLGNYKYVAVLACGCTVGGETRTPEIVELGVHGAPCPQVGDFSVFAGFVSTKPERDRWGRV